MKPTNTQTVHHVGRAEEDVKMSIDQASIVHIMTLLTDLYSDPQMAVIREYSTNAYDSNVEAGNPAPIIVTLPTSHKPEFKVQDNGVGLSVDDIKKVYSLYGASTKRDSNLMNGMLGLGCKSGLTYALSFTVTAVKNGVRTIATVTKDTDGVGTIKVLDTKGTTEGNGVTITIPVQSHHVTFFNEKAMEFYKYWPAGTVLVNGEEPDRSFFDDAIWLDDDVAVFKDGNMSKIIMGNVAYPWDTRTQSINLSKTRTGRQVGYNNPDIFDHSIVVRVPIGTVDFTPSREALHETTLTKDTLDMAMRYVLDRFPIALRDQCRQAPTPFEQAKILNQWRYAARNTTKGALSEFRDNLEVTHSKDRIVWHWSRYGNSVSKDRADWRYLMDESNYLVVHGFPFKAVSQSHRSRIMALDAWYGHGKPNKGECPRRALILPQGANIAVLEGRKNALSWDDVLVLTPEPPKEVRAARQRTAKYTVVQNHRTFEKDVLDPKDGPIVWRKRIDPRSWNSQDGIAGQHPEAQVVKLYERQIEKFLKLHPTAVNITVYHDAEVKKAEKALTKDDRECTGSDGYMWNRLADIGLLSAVKDPDFKRIDALRGHAKKSKTFQRAVALGIHPTTSGSTVYDRVIEKYPLLSTYNYWSTEHLDDLTIYINAKYAQSKKSKPTGGK